MLNLYLMLALQEEIVNSDWTRDSLRERSLRHSREALPDSDTDGEGLFAPAQPTAPLDGPKEKN